MVALALLVALIGVAAALVVFEIPEGMPWSFRVRDFDRGLTRAARRLLPLAAAVDAYRQARGRCPDQANASDLAAIRADLSEDLRPAVGRGGYDFNAAPGNPAICRAAIRLTHDELLYRESDGTTAQWFYEPGDGTDRRAVRLAP